MILRFSYKKIINDLGHQMTEVSKNEEAKQTNGDMPCGSSAHGNPT